MSLPAVPVERRVAIYVTGFGPFGGVETNPTSLFVPRVAEYWRLNANTTREPLRRASIAESVVMEVSASGAGASLEALYASASALHAAEPQTSVVFLHCGVAAGLQAYFLEAVGCNENDFRIPDARGVSLRGTPICAERPLRDQLHTTLPLRRIAAGISGSRLPVRRSEDAGRFLCNFALFKSLDAVAAMNATAAAPGGAAAPAALPSPPPSVETAAVAPPAAPPAPWAHACFIHVPSIEDASLDEQLHVISSVISAVARHVLLGDLADVGEGEDERGGISAGAGDGIATAAAAAAVQSASKNGVVLGAAVGGSGGAPAAASLTATPPPTVYAVLLRRLEGFGFEDAQCASAIRALRVEQQIASAVAAHTSGGTTAAEAAEMYPLDEIIECIVSGGAAAAALAPPAVAAAAPSSASATRDFKMVIVMRSDLELSKGKTASQACHAALKAVKGVSARAGGKDLVRTWQQQGEPIVVLRCSDLAHLRTIQGAAVMAGLPTATISDAGRTEVEPGTLTALAVGPAPIASIDAVTGTLRLL